MLTSWIRFIFGPDVRTIDTAPFNPFSLVLLLVPLFLLRRRGKSAGYLLCLSLFFLYMWAVFAYTICPIHIHPEYLDLTRHAVGWENRFVIHSVPAIFSDNPEGFDIRSVQVYGNFLLGMPFGFGLPFVAHVTPRRALWCGLGFAAGIELAQFGLNVLFYQFCERTVDIDDVWLVFAGTLVGHLALRAAASVYRRLGWADGARLPGWDHMHAVLLRVASASR